MNKKTENLPAQKIKKIEVKFNLNKVFNKSFVYILIGLLFLPMIFSFLTGSDRERISLSQLVKDVREEKVKQIGVEGTQLVITYKENQVKTTQKEPGQEIVPLLETAGIDLTTVDVEIKNQSASQIK